MEPLQRVIPTGCSSLDRLLNGGFPCEGISLVYGEAETGKSSLAIQCAVNTARMSRKTLFIDSDYTFSPKRLSQIAYHDSQKISPLITLVRPTNFEEQTLAIDHLGTYITEKVGLVVVDTITSLYRAELGGSEKTFALNRELNRQVACLAETAKTHKVAALILSQVRSVFAETHVSIEPVATRVLKFWSNVVVNLKNAGSPRVIKALLEKRLERKSPASCYLLIESSGIFDYGRKS